MFQDLETIYDRLKTPEKRKVDKIGDTVWFGRDEPGGGEEAEKFILGTWRKYRKFIEDQELYAGLEPLDEWESELFLERLLKGKGGEYRIPSPKQLGVHEPSRLLKRGEPRVGMRILDYTVTKASASKVTITSAPPERDPGYKMRKRSWTYTWDGTGYEKTGRYLFNDDIKAAGEWRQPSKGDRLPIGTKVRSDRYNYIIAGPPEDAFRGTDYPGKTKKGTTGTLHIDDDGKHGSWTTPKGTRTDLYNIVVQVMEGREQTSSFSSMLETAQTA